MTPTFAAIATPGIQIPVMSPITASILMTMSVHHHSRGKRTPSKQSRMNLGGRTDIAASTKSASARMAGGHHESGVRGIRSFLARADRLERCSEANLNVGRIGGRACRPTEQRADVRGIQGVRFGW